jgi:hypothetical protein
MKVFCVCEGVTDVDPLQVLMQKCTPDSDLKISIYTHVEIKGMKIKVHHKDKSAADENKKLSRKLYIKKLYALAIMEHSCHIAYHQDAGRQGFNMVYTGIKNDFLKAVSNTKTRWLAIVPKEMIESWLLADVKALNSLKNISEDLPSVNQSPNPEGLWGKKEDLNSDYPKNYLTRDLNKLGRDADSATYKEIAEKCNINILKKRCPESFGQFYCDMQSFIFQEAGVP